ncbi:hypothetical protein C8Q73DRAFT_104979 [Cubamyces lactineus]|nr:hypothetical protein C8Q73DRAFT_104979 [Cubamyces lactineus]
MTTRIHLPTDVIHEILVLLSDFSTLSAAIRTSKSFYDTFQARSKLIVRAVLINVVGPALPQAARLEQYKQNVASTDDPRMLTLPSEEHFRGPNIEVTRATALAMEKCANAVRILEDFYSIRFKDRTCRSSRLNPEETLRFGRAMYRYWLCYELLKNVAFTFRPDEDEDEDEDDEDYYQAPGNDDEEEGLDKDRRLTRDGFLSQFTDIPSEELFEILEMCAFLKDTETWMGKVYWKSYYPYGQLNTQNHGLGAYLIHVVPTPWTPVDPLQLARHIEAHRPQEDYFRGHSDHDLISNAARRVLHLRKVPEDRLAAPIRAIVTSPNGSQDCCSRCQAVCGTSLFGSSNMFLLGGLMSTEEQTALLPGVLYRNRDEMRLLRHHIKDHQRLIPTETIVHEMMDMDPEGEDADGEHWSKDEWYCMECIKQLFRNRFMLWWREAKRQSGAPAQDDCWYGYNCRTMTHKSAHATKLNVSAKCNAAGPMR